MTEPTAAGPAEETAAAPLNRMSRTQSPTVGLAALVAYAAVPLTAALTTGTGFLVALVASQAVDVLVTRDPYVRAVFGRGGLGIATRTLIRELSAVALVLAASHPRSGTARAEALIVLGIPALRLLHQMMMVLVRRRTVLVVETRNIDLSGLRLPRQLPLSLTTRPSERLHALSAIGLAFVAVAVLSSTAPVLYAGTGLVVLVELAVVAYVGRAFFGMKRTLARDKLLAAVNARVAALRPEVVLYHSGDEDSAYQANMWLSALDSLQRRTLIIFRERHCWAQLGRTTSPAVCIPGSVDFMTFPLPDVRVAMYTANVGKTIHLLREPGIQHVFIGHGDSDKSASSNPFSRVYSEIWVAGQAGRDRYRKARVGVRDDDIVEVGRPQLDGIDAATPLPEDGQLTVLYAPTWEGWVSDPAHTSVVRTGPKLVEQLVALPGVQLVYKPHPLTGTVSVDAAKADQRIRSTIARVSSAGHRVAEGSNTKLYDCFNDAHVLVADISSVLSDFVQSQKPYVVPNLTGLDDDAFREQFPSTGAAYVLDPSASRIGAILDLVRSDDPMAAQRLALKHYLLGPDEPSAMDRFAAAVDAAYDRAVEAWPVRPTLTVSTV